MVDFITGIIIGVDEINRLKYWPGEHDKKEGQTNDQSLICGFSE
jgi:hypothetical protein